MQSAFPTELVFSQGGPLSNAATYWLLKASKRERQKTSLSPDRRGGSLETSRTERDNLVFVLPGVFEVKVNRKGSILLGHVPLKPCSPSKLTCRALPQPMQLISSNKSSDESSDSQRARR